MNQLRPSKQLSKYERMCSESSLNLNFCTDHALHEVPANHEATRWLPREMVLLLQNVLVLLRISNTVEVRSAQDLLAPCLVTHHSAPWFYRYCSALLLWWWPSFKLSSSELPSVQAGMLCLTKPCYPALVGLTRCTVHNAAPTKMLL